MTDPRIEASYAYATDDVEIGTIEVRHPAILSETGDEGVIRIAAVDVPPSELEQEPYFQARLEADAPMDAGEIVNFVRGKISIERPEKSTSGVPQAVLRVQNVDARIGQAFELVADSGQPAECTVRVFTEATRLSGLPDVLSGLELIDPEISLVEVSVRAQGPDVVNFPLHRQRYDRRFPLLSY
ncbi:MAG: DUF1833 family protein [Pseudomonadota bacterium]